MLAVLLMGATVCSTSDIDGVSAIEVHVGVLVPAFYPFDEYAMASIHIAVEDANAKDGARVGAFASIKQSFRIVPHYLPAATPSEITKNIAAVLPRLYRALLQL